MLSPSQISNVTVLDLVFVCSQNHSSFKIEQMIASEKLRMDTDETTVVLFICTDSTKPHDKTTEADRPIQYRHQLHELAGIQITLKVDKCTSEGVYVSAINGKVKSRGNIYRLTFLSQEVIFKRKVGGLCVLLLLAIVVLCAHFTKERLFEKGKNVHTFAQIAN